MDKYLWDIVARLLLSLLAVAGVIGLIAFAAFRLGGLPLLPKKSSDVLLHEALTLEESGRHHDALARFNEAIERGASADDALLARGACLLALDRPTEAETDFARFAQSHPSHADAVAQIGRARAMRGDHPGALEAFEKSLEIDGEVAEVWYWKAGALFRLGRNAEAEASYGKAVELNPLLGPAIEGRAQVRLQQYKFQAAFADFVTAGELLPDSPAILSGCGLSLMGLGRIPEAEAAFSEAIRLDPAAPRTLHNRALARFAMGQYPAALEDADSALRHDPSLHKVYLLRGMILAKEGKHADAVDSISEAIRRNPDDPSAYRHRAASLRALGRADLAQQDEQSAASRPTSPSTNPEPYQTPPPR